MLFAGLTLVWRIYELNGRLLPTFAASRFVVGSISSELDFQPWSVSAQLKKKINMPWCRHCSLSWSRSLCFVSRLHCVVAISASLLSIWLVSFVTTSWWKWRMGCWQNWRQTKSFLILAELAFSQRLCVKYTDNRVDACLQVLLIEF